MNDKHFIDWESETFGYGYGTGEQYTLAALKGFFDNLEEDRLSRYEQMERSFTPTVAWLMINALCKCDVLEYGTSPRYSWLTKRGEILRDYLKIKTVGKLYEICMSTTEDYVYCYKDHCNCEPELPNCNNPMFDPKTR